MGTVLVRRPPRRPVPELPSGDLAVPAPPAIPEPVGSRWLQLLQLLPMLTGTVATALLFAGRSGDRYSLVIGGIFGVSTLGMLATGWGSGGGQPSRSEMIAARRDYLRQLAAMRDRVRDTVARQRRSLHYRHPDPGRLWSTAESFRLWERRSGDGDFGVVRVGLGPQTLATPLVPPVTAEVGELEPVTAGALRRFLDVYSVVPNLPVAVSLRGFTRVCPRGPDGVARGLVRAMLAQLVTFHAPDDLRVAVCAGPDRRGEWDWIKWLPHALHPTRIDGAGPVRLFATSGADLQQRIGDLFANRTRFAGESRTTPHLVVVLDGGDLTDARHLADDGALDGVTLLDLDGARARTPDRTTIIMDVAGGRLSIATVGDSADVGVPDSLSRVEAEALARRLAPRRLAGTEAGTDEPLRRELGLVELLGIGDPATFEVARAAAPRPQRDRLRVPVGVGADGQPVVLDLKESAQDGMGPHGLVIGATGSGKSELLRTLVLGLAATHSSASLNFVLIDYKGGATFATLDRLPHVAAVITNLADELPLVDRMSDAINGELLRRQDLLRRAGNHASIRDYEEARAAGAPLAPLPSLLIVCDEFSELLTAKPDFIDLFVQIGRVGRSLGMHLLLASQRLEEGRLRGLDTHLSYRIGLRTFSALESRAVLGVPDAYELPRAPGHGYLKYGTEPLVRFKAAYASGPYRPAARPAADAAPGAGRRVVDYTTHEVPLPASNAPSPAAGAGEPAGALIDVLVDRLAGQGIPAHQVWLPPLDESPGLDDLFGPVAADSVRGLNVGNPELRGALQVPVGLVDKPLEQRRDVLWLRLSAAAGHVAVVGGARSGKSTLIRTLIAGLALTHTPAEAQVYCLDFGGGALASLADLPHVGGVAGRQDITAVRRTVAELVTLLARRERRFAELKIASVTEYRQRRAAGPTGDPYGDVFLVVDGWSTLRTDYDELELTITDLATRGLAYGVHVVAAAMRWNDFRPSIRDLFGTRLELRLGEPGDSEIDRRLATNVPQAPGRGITGDRYHFLTALPRIATADPTELIGAVAAGWTGSPAPPVRLLPELVPYAEIADDRDDARPLALPIGIGEDDLRPIRLDFAAEPHVLLFGDAECGKTTFLRALAHTIVSRFPPERARIMLVDYRRGLLGSVTSEHLIGYGTGAQQAMSLIESAAAYMERRLPGPDVRPEQLRDRGWWTGPELFVLVDDYDLVSTGPTNPLEPLLDFLPQARDIGLHVVLTRRTGGASRALYEPVVQRIRELSGPGLVMSGDRDEGPLLGNVRPGPLPPGRARLVTRRDGVRLVQLVHLPRPE
jgi:S-DNA-T family DNA segregation ATPase FtsK/SpoIIIE